MKKKNDNNGIKLIKEFLKICIIYMEKNLVKKTIEQRTKNIK